MTDNERSSYMLTEAEAHAAAISLGIVIAILAGQAANDADKAARQTAEGMKLLSKHSNGNSLVSAAKVLAKLDEDDEVASPTQIFDATKDEHTQDEDYPKCPNCGKNHPTAEMVIDAVMKKDAARITKYLNDMNAAHPDSDDNDDLKSKIDREWNW